MRAVAIGFGLIGSLIEAGARAAARPSRGTPLGIGHIAIRASAASPHPRPERLGSANGLPGAGPARAYPLEYPPVLRRRQRRHPVDDALFLLNCKYIIK